MQQNNSCFVSKLFPPVHRGSPTLPLPRDPHSSSLHSQLSSTMESLALSSSTSSLIPYTRTSLTKRTSFLHLKSLPSISPITISSTPFFLNSPISNSKPFIKPLNSLTSTQSPTTNPSSIKQNSTSQGGGAKIVPLAISISIGLIIRFIIPKPVEVSLQAWQLLSIFLATNVGLVLSPLPIGAWAFLSLTISILTKTLTFYDAFTGFSTEVIWLIVISFFFARGFTKTGLGDRIATYFVKWFGKTALGLSYGLTLGETLVAPAMPSTVARVGGMFLPIIESTLLLSTSSETDDLSRRRLGAFLIQSQLQSAGNSSALFLTAAANNLLCLKLAEGLGIKIASPWITWFKAASVPAFVSLLATPFILYKIYPPGTAETLDAPAIAALKLEQLGPITKNEWIMMATMLLAVSFWIFGDALGIASVATAMLSLCILLILGVVDWEDCLKDKAAWDTLTWFAVLVGMAGQLTNLGIVAWMSNCVANFLQSFSLSTFAAFGVLHAAYFFIHYIFASQAAHIGALYSSFIAMQMASGVPGVLAALSLAYNTSLFGALTHYSSAQAAAYYGAGYVSVPEYIKLGIMMAIVNIVIWGGVGTLWWKYLGLF